LERKQMNDSSCRTVVLRVSSNGLELLKKFEGFRAIAYKDTAGRLTIGFGHLIKPGEHFTVISSVQGLSLLIQDSQESVDCINKLVTVKLNQNQFDALVSFTYNLGCAALAASTLLKDVNKGDFVAAANEFHKWNHNRVNGKMVVVDGLTNRRNMEAQLFSKEV